MYTVVQYNDAALIYRHNTALFVVFNLNILEDVLTQFFQGIPKDRIKTDTINGDYHDYN